ncbi:hypothetical protein [Streptomyces mutabilis]
MPLTYDNVVSILAEITGMDEDEITPQTTLLDVAAKANAALLLRGW